MSFASSNQKCPRCQTFVAAGVATCPTCGLVLSGAGSYGAAVLPSASPQSQDALANAPTVAALYPQEAGAAAAFSSTPPPPPVDYANLYPGSQPPADYAYALPSAPSSISGPAVPLTAPTAAPPGNRRRIALILLVVLLLLGGGGGIAAYLLLAQPQPTITVTSAYQVGTTPVGATDTVFHVTGQQFSSNATITFLLDGQPAPEAQTVQSDGNGNVKADLTVTANWAPGNHTLTASDQNNHVTKQGRLVQIVAQGADGTSGPHGAPTDSASFTLKVTVHPVDQNGNALQPFSQTLAVNLPQLSAAVCDPTYDDSKAHTFGPFDLGNGFTYTETYTFKCAGSYQGGQVIYTETATNDEYDFYNSSNTLIGSCTATSAYTYEALQGSFSSATESSGQFSSDAASYDCTNPQWNHVLHQYALTGTWEASK